MFDIGFTELLLVAVVALIVVGPEKLPSVVRTMLSYIRQFKTSFNHIKAEVERELDLEELKDEFDDNKNHIEKTIGYDDLHQSLDDLRKESENLREIAEDGFEYANNPAYDNDKEPTDAEIEADLEALTTGPRLPDPLDEAETGIEVEISNNK
ncbi:MAG: Sec-independent protein translocase protein TatB [Ostreibacterium sp.]